MAQNEQNWDLNDLLYGDQRGQGKSGAQPPPQPVRNQPYSTQDHEQLQDLVNSQSRVPAHPAPDTPANFKALKAKGWLRPDLMIGQFVSGLWCTMCNTFASLFCKHEHSKSGMCSVYGHVVDRKNWGDGFPKCIDCGAEVTSADQLRGSSARH